MWRTFEDWAAHEPPEGHRVELVEGRFRVRPPQHVAHQRAVGRVQRLLDDAVAPAGLGVLSSVGVHVGENAYVPDVVVFTEPGRERACLVSADVVLVVEVQSPSTETVDRVEKVGAYAGAGVPVYWLVDPRQNTVRCHVLDGGRYAEPVVVSSGNPAAIRITDDIVVELDADTLFAPRRQPGTVGA
jgi:Uma2 family endonuclease